jgi:hypothetical protein
MDSVWIVTRDGIFLEVSSCLGEAQQAAQWYDSPQNVIPFDWEQPFTDLSEYHGQGKLGLYIVFEREIYP